MANTSRRPDTLEVQEDLNPAARSETAKEGFSRHSSGIDLAYLCSRFSVAC